MVLTKIALPISDTDQVVKVATQGMDNRSQKMLALTINKNYHGLIELINTGADADALLIDLDSKEANALLKKHLQKDKPIIVMSIRHICLDQVVTLRKPINISVLLKTIRELTQGVTPEEINRRLPQPPGHIITSSKIDYKPQAKKANSKIKITANSLNERAENYSAAELIMKRAGVADYAGLYYKQDDYALGYLLKAVMLARSQSACVKLTCWGKPFIVFNPARNEEILTNMSEGMIRSLGVMRSIGEELQIESHLMTAAEFSALLKDNADTMTLFSAQAFIWKLTLLTARGRVPEGTDLMQPVFLQHWPNFTRLEPIHHSLRIAALWSKQPRSLLSLFGILGIPFEHILNLYSAANAIGLAGPANRKADTLIEPGEPKEHCQRSLFSSLLKKLTGKS